MNKRLFARLLFNVEWEFHILLYVLINVNRYLWHIFMSPNPPVSPKFTGFLRSIAISYVYLVFHTLRVPCEVALMRMMQNLIDYRSISVQVMAWFPHSVNFGQIPWHCVPPFTHYVLRYLSTFVIIQCSLIVCLVTGSKWHDSFVAFMFGLIPIDAFTNTIFNGSIYNVVALIFR